ncbi:MAG TPA: farnesyl diphosphate synthase [Candidatus Polarisedimenticolaceae bacterium]|nr:farnesyl diphosphate synthase [Candidatus Polarisedimenticolaceae bacterium]
MTVGLDDYLAARAADVERALDELLPAATGPAARLHEAMRYAVFGGGKRLRPALALAVCESLGGRVEEVVAPAAALELVHTYSLVHDDLPAMDDDDLRRGRPTVHKAFGEAEAILAGDALLTLALEILATKPEGDEAAVRRSAAVALVARGAGAAGMVGGQLADLDAERKPAELPALEWIHAHKTGALLAASAELGALHAGAPPPVCRAFARFGAALGLAFQIADDILDRTATAAALGKTPGKDERAGKATYPALLGVDRSRAEADRLAAQARAEIPESVRDRGLLDALARYAVERGR